MKCMAWVGMGLLVLLSGCGQDEPTSYRVPKEEKPAAKPVEMAAPAPAQQAPAGLGFKADLPQGWSELPATGMRKVSYAIKGSRIDFYLISLTMGDLTSNVNRWRGQVTLAPESTEAIDQAAESWTVDGRSMRYIEIYNPAVDKGIIAAIYDQSPAFWYFTAKGSVAELEAHADEIRAFLKSIKLESH